MMLSMIRLQTGSVVAIPLKRKGDVRYMCTELMRFVQTLGHPEIVLRSDFEPLMNQVKLQLAEARKRWGFHTTIEDPAVRDKGGNSEVQCSNCSQSPSVRMSIFLCRLGFESVLRVPRHDPVSAYVWEAFFWQDVRI